MGIFVRCFSLLVSYMPLGPRFGLAFFALPQPAAASLTRARVTIAPLGHCRTAPGQNRVGPKPLYSRYP